MLSKKQLIILLSFAIVLTTLLAIRDVVGIAINKNVFIVAFLVFSLLVNYKILASALAFLFPLTWGLPYTYLFSCAILIYWVKRNTIPKHTAILLCVFFIHELVSSYWYPDHDFIEILKYFSIISIFFTFLYDEIIPKETSIKFFYFGTIVLCVIVFISTLKNAPSNWLELFSNGWYRFGQHNRDDVDGMMLSLNSNSLAYYSIVGFAISINYISKNKGIWKWLNIMALLLFFTSCVFTVSFSGILVLGGCISVFFFTRIKRVSSVLFFFATALFLLMALQIIQSRAPELLEAFTSRTNKTEFDKANDRLPILMEYNNIFWSNPRFVLIGTGVVQYNAVASCPYSIHNMLQQLFVCYGLFIAPIYLAGMFKPLMRINRHNIELLNWIPLLAVIFFVQTIQFINPPALMLPYVIAYYWLAIHSSPPKEEDNEVLHHNS